MDYSQASLSFYLHINIWQKAARYFLYAIGSASILGILFKQTNIATGVVCILAITLLEIYKNGWLRAIRSLMQVAIFPILVITLISLYWGFQNAFSDLWQATVSYNFLYSSGSWGLRSLYGAVRTLTANQSIQPLLILAFGTIFDLLLRRIDWSKDLQFIMKLNGRPESAVTWTYMVYALAFLGEIAILSLQGRGFGHYYITLFPTLCALVSYWIRRIPEDERPVTRKRNLPSTWLPLVISIFMVWILFSVGLVRPSINDIYSFRMDAPDRKPLRTNVGKYVVSQTILQDTILYWDVGAEIYFETGRKAPSRYFYFLPLFQPGFQNSQRWSEFLWDLKTNPPELVIAQNGTGYAPSLYGSLPDLQLKCNCSGNILDGFTEFLKWLHVEYEPQLMWNQAFVVFQRKNP